MNYIVTFLFFYQDGFGFKKNYLKIDLLFDKKIKPNSLFFLKEESILRGIESAIMLVYLWPPSSERSWEEWGETTDEK